MSLIKSSIIMIIVYVESTGKELQVEEDVLIKFKNPYNRQFTNWVYEAIKSRSY